MIRRRLFLLVFCSILLISVSVYGDGLTGQEILDNLRDESAFMGSGSAQINLITVNPRGAKRYHQLKVYRFEDEGVEKQFLEYLEPPDVRGTRFLSIQEGQEEAQMWLYLPALGRERRIAGHMTRDSFMGTDFTYDEIGGSQTYSVDYQATRLSDVVFDHYDCYLLELTPIKTDSEFSRLKMWVWKDEMIPLKIEFYDLEGRHIKTLNLGQLTLQSDGDYIPYYLEMSQEINKTRTIIEILETDRGEIPEEFFTLRYLRR